MDIRMSNIASPMPQPRAKFTNKLGLPLSGGKVYTYEPGTNIPKKTWRDVDKSVENTNPIQLDAAGEADIYGVGFYRVVVKDFLGLTIYDVEKTGIVVELDASFVVDASGKTQQEINNLWNLFVNAKNDGSQDVSEIFTNYCNALDDGDTVVIPKGEYFWDSTRGTRVITKNINIECRGVFKVKPSGNQMLIFSGSDGAVTVPMTTATSLNKGEDRLNITTVAGVTKPEEYFVSMQSTEELTKRTGADLENSTYTKNLTADVVSNTFRLRDQLPFGWDDLSLGTLQFIKKKRHVTIRGLRIEPTESGVFNAISTNRASNITFEDLEIAGNKSNSFTVRIDLSYNIRFKQTLTTDASAAAGYYAILNNQSSYIYLDGVGYIDGAVSNRGYAARHGFKCYFTNCLLNGIDDHWGYDYDVDKCNLVIGIGVAGGSLTVNKSTSMQTLVRQRTDTPYNDGKLTIKNSWGWWGLLVVARHTTGGTFYTPRKAWDYIDIDVGLYDDHRYNNGIIEVQEPYQDIDTNLVFKETVMHIRNAVIQNNANGKKLIGTSKQRTNNSGSGTEVDWFDGTFESKRLFKKIIVDNVTTVNSGSVAINPLFTFPCATTIEVRNVDDFGFECLRAQELITDNIVIKGSNFKYPFGHIDVAEWHGSRIRTKENHAVYTWTKALFPTPSSFLSSSRLYSRTYVYRAFGDTVKSAVGMTYETVNYNNTATQEYKSRNNYVENTVYSHTFGSDVVVAANAVSAEYYVSAHNNDIGNIVIGSFANGGDGLLINAYRTGHGHIKFKVKNLTGVDITIPAGSVIHFVIY